MHFIHLRVLIHQIRLHTLLPKSVFDCINLVVSIKDIIYLLLNTLYLKLMNNFEKISIEMNSYVIYAFGICGALIMFILILMFYIN